MTRPDDLEKSYQKMQKRYGLPDFSKLDFEFEINSRDTEENTTYFLRYVRRRMNDRLAFFTRLIENILHPPSPSLASTYEDRVLTDEDRQILLEQFKRLMILEREAFMLEATLDEKGDAGYVKTVMKDWPRIKEQLIHVFRKIERAWQSEETINLENYFG